MKKYLLDCEKVDNTWSKIISDIKGKSKDEVNNMIIKAIKDYVDIDGKENEDINDQVFGLELASLMINYYNFINTKEIKKRRSGK